jgi:hypothetical protein
MLRLTMMTRGPLKQGTHTSSGILWRRQRKTVMLLMQTMMLQKMMLYRIWSPLRTHVFILPLRTALWVLTHNFVALICEIVHLALLD